jgi:hypothetical protein
VSDPRFLQNGFDKILSHAVEECGEFLAAAGKTQRWGVRSVNPLLPVAQQESNLVWLRREMKDVIDVLRRLDRAMEAEFGCDPISRKTSRKIETSKYCRAASAPLT